MFKLNILRLEYNLRDQSSQSENFQKWYLKLLAILFNAFFLTPIVIIYWACAWDIMYDSKLIKN